MAFFVGSMLFFTATAGAQEMKDNSLDLRLKSESTALKYSLYGTLVPIGTGLAIHDITGARLIVIGALIGPSLGYFYGGEPRRAMIGIGVRVGIGAVTVVAAIAVGDAAAKSDPGSFAGTGEAMGVLAVGSIIVIIHAIHDITKVKSVVAKHNLEFIRQNQTSVTLVPKYFVASSAIGLELQATF
jgi:hypothetical protein